MKILGKIISYIINKDGINKTHQFFYIHRHAKAFAALILDN